MLCQKTVPETYYDILSVNEDASYEEIRASYRSAILSNHPDKLQNVHHPDPDNGSGGRFLKVQKAWEILGNSSSRAVYDRELQALRQDVGIGEDVNIEDMMIEDSGEFLELLYQCRCGDYFAVDSLELGKMGYKVWRGESKISFQTPDTLPASVVLPCGSCSLQVRLLIDTNIKVSMDNHL